MIGVVSYGFYVPRYRIKLADIADVWGKNADEITSALHVYEKAVSATDEDSVTMAYESSRKAMEAAEISPKKINTVFFGSETPAYAVNPSSTILAEMLGIEGNYLASDLQFACKAATGAMISATALIQSKKARYVLVSASDKATGKPHDALEYTAASGSVSMILGDRDVALEIIDSDSFSSDTPDFWRREGMRYPSHGGRFTGKPSYFFHISQAVKNIMRKNKMKPAQFDHVVFHLPNGKFPRQIAKSLGFTEKQIKNSLVVDELGNSYTASALMGLVSVLEKVKTNDRILLASYGSGAGSDAFIFRATGLLAKRKQIFNSVVANKEYIPYDTYLKYMHII